MKRNLLVLLMTVFLLPSLSFAKEKTIKLGKTMIYTGEVLDKKTPSGYGFIVFNNQAKRPSEADTIRGLFSIEGESLVVSNAMGVFANGARFQGEITISIKVISEKPVIEKAVCDLNGHLEWPGNPMTTGQFKVCRQTNCEANTFELTLDPFDTKDVNTMIYRHGAYKGNLENGSTPKGEGMLSVVAYNRYASTKVLDVIEGVFDGNHVTNAKLKFNSGYQFVGDLDYDVSENGNDEVYTYNLDGYLMDNTGKGLLLDSAFVIRRHTDFSTFRTMIEDFVGSSYLYYLDNEYTSLTGCDTLKVLRKVSISEKKPGIWQHILDFAENEPVYYYNNGAVVTKFKNGFTVDRKDASFVVKDGHLSEFLKDYEEGFFHYVKDGQSQIIYYDGSKYEGTLSISSDHECRSIEEEVSTYLEVPRMNDYRIMYHDGTSTLANGKRDVWKNGLTDYQNNKIAGNYEGRKELYAQALAEEAKAADKVWEEARPVLEQDYGKRYVDALYGYRLIEGMPLSLFKRLQEMKMPYYDLMGPFSANHGPFNIYLITVKNRQTGEYQYQRSLYFDKYNRLYKISTRL